MNNVCMHGNISGGHVLVHERHREADVRGAERQRGRRVFYELPIHPAMMRINGQLSHLYCVIAEELCTLLCAGFVFTRI